MKKIIGSGAYAHVFRVHSQTVNQDFALKLIELRKVSQNYRNHFLKNEISVLRHLRHRNVVKFIETFPIDNSKAYVMVMEFLPNGTFCDHLFEHGVFTEKLAHKLFVDIGSGLEYMHGLAIAHRDLKLENLLLSPDNVGKISDFSLSIQWDRKKLADNYCGTLPYFAPEILMRFVQFCNHLILMPPSSTFFVDNHTIQCCTMFGVWVCVCTSCSTIVVRSRVKTMN